MSFEQALAELAAVFPDVAVSNGNGITFVRIPTVALPAGCTPGHTSVLLEVQPNARPALFVSPGIRLPNGHVPRSTSDVLKNGESWLQFSYQFPWDPDKGLVAFMGAALRRFALNE